MNWIKKLLYKRKTLRKLQEDIWALEMGITINEDIIKVMLAKKDKFLERIKIEQEFQDNLNLGNCDDRQKLKKSKMEQEDWQKSVDVQQKEMEKGNNLISASQEKILQQREKIDIIKEKF